MVQPFNILMEQICDWQIDNYNSDWRWQLLAELYNKNYQPSITSNLDDYTYTKKIPKLIHQIWLGSPFPEAYRIWAESWKSLNPDYEYKLWTDADVDSLELPNRQAYDEIPNLGPKSDILRFHILNKFGGIYIDTDFECLKSFDELSYLEFYTSVGYPSAVELYPGLMASIPHHPIVEACVKEIDKVTVNDIRSKGILKATSSYLFTDVFFNVIKEYQKGIVAFPPDYFYPYPNNFKGFREADGRKFIKPISFAIHYWESSWQAAIRGNKDNFDWVQGYKFVEIADFVYSPQNKAGDDYAKYPNTFDPDKLKDNEVNFVICCTMYLGRLLRILNSLPQKFVVISHNGDQHVDPDGIGTYANAVRTGIESYTLTDNIVMLYAVNPNIDHPRVRGLAVGIENSMWKSQKKEIMLQLRKQPVNRTGFVLMNHGMSTNKEERRKVYDLFKPMPWVTTYDKTTYQQFYELLNSFKFILNPMGNCFDNHRMWEAWYLGCIPISKRSICIDNYKDFPHVIVDDWSEVTEEFLNKEYERISNMNFDPFKLTFAYWRNKVKTLQ